MIYKCPRCLYESEKKHHILKHINRKKICELKFLDINPKDYIDIITLTKGSGLEILQENEKMKEEIENMKKENQKIKKQIKKEMKQEIKIINEENRKLRKENEKLKNEVKIINNTTNDYSTTNNNNITNHITFVLNPRNDPEYNYLTDKDYKKYLERMINSIPSLIQKLNLNQMNS